MVANDNPTSPTSSIIENMGSPLSSNAGDLSLIDHPTRDAAAANTVTPVQGNGSTSPTSISTTVHPTFTDNMDVDIDDISTMQQCASADNADHLQELADTANQLTKQIAVASAKLPTLHGEARRTALQEIQDLALTIKTSNELLASFASKQSNKATTLVTNSPQATQAPATIRPDNLPYFQWEGSVFDARLPWSVDVDACLTKFEDVMHFYSLAFDKEFLRLVPPMLSPTQRTWYQSFLVNHQAPTWMDFKTSFKARYGISVVDDRQKCAAELMNISLQPNESFNSLVDRFNDLRRRAFDQLPQPFLLVSRLMLILPSPLRSQVNIIRQSKGITSITADMVIQIAQELMASMTPSEVSAAMGYTVPATPAPHTSSKATAASTPTATTIPIQHGYASKVAKPAPSGHRFTPHGSSSNMSTYPSRSQKYCTYHKSRAHNTSECNAYAAALSSAATSERGANPPCDNCGAPNYIEGHVCNTATRTGDPPSAPEHRFRMMKIHDSKGRMSSSSREATTTMPASNMPPKKYCTFHRSAKHNTSDCRAFAEHLQSVASELDISSGMVASPASATDGMSSSTAAPSTTVPSDDRPNDSMDIDTIIATAAQKCKLNEFSSLPVNKSNSLLVPLIIENIKVYGVLDTGCTFSICAPQFAKSLGITIDTSHTNGFIQLGHTSSTQPRIGSCHLHVFYNKRNFTHKFEIFDFYTDSNDCPILLGLDIMSQLNIGVTGLTSSWFEYTGPDLPSPIDPDVEPNNDPFGSPSERKTAYSHIEPLLKQNSEIDLGKTYCNLPGAVVQLETIPGKTAYRAPYPVPVVYKDAVLAQIDQWLQDGVLEPSPSHTGWNHPLLVVAKKNADGAYSFDKPRIVADVRLLNQILVSDDKYQMPRIDDIHQKFSSARIITSIDVKSFFTSFLVDERYRFKLSVTCPFTGRQFMFRKICFGVQFIGNLTSRALSTLFADMGDQVCMYTHPEIFSVVERAFLN